MGIYIEALILYVVLFFSRSTGLFVSGGTQGFPITAELVRIFAYTIPSLALIWYLLLKARSLSSWGIRPGKKDILSGLITLPSLLITGFIIAFISSNTGGTSAQALLYVPATVPEWMVLCFSCVSAAYLEESFFRFYLLVRREELKLGAASALVFSVALFSICHIYEGPWGFLNSVLSGTFLSLVFLCYKSLHGIAIAHGLYNIAVYVLNAALALKT